MLHFFKTLASLIPNAKAGKLRLFADADEIWRTKNALGEVRTLGNAVRSITKIGTSVLVDTYRVVTDDFSFDIEVTNGRGIANIEPPANAGQPDSTDTYTVRYNDGTTSTFIVRNGRDGVDGVVTSVNGKSEPNIILTAADVGAIPAAELGLSVAQLVDGTVPAAQLPAFVDDVLEFDSFALFPTVGERGKIYVDLSDDNTYRWSGSQYIEISKAPVFQVNGKVGNVTLTTSDIAEGTNLYFTAQRVRDTVLTGLSLVTNAAITASDTVLSAFGKLQKQLSDHFAAVDPHPQYTTDTEAQTIANGAVATHVALADPHSQYTTDSEATTIAQGRVTAHEGLEDPHPQYLTSTEGNAAYTPLSHVNTGGGQHALATPNTTGGAGGTGGLAGFLSPALRTNIGNLFGPGAVYNIKDYGAVADDVLGAGGTDNSAAIQAAIDAAQAAGGGIVFVPAGNYSIQAGLTVRSSGVHIMGAGCGYTADVGDYRTGLVSCISWRGAAGAVMLDVFPQSGATVFPLFGFRLTGLSLDGRDLQVGPTDTGATPPAIGIRMRACSGAHLSDFFLNGPFTTAALDLTTLPPGTIGGVDSHGVLRCIFERFCIRQLDGAVTPGIGLRFSGSATANVNFCKFDTFQIMYRNNSTRQPAIQLGNSDSNTFIMGACNSNGALSTNWGIEILGSNSSAAEVSRANIFYHCSHGTGGTFLAGTALGRNPSNTADATLNFTNPSTDNQFRPLSTENGEPVPVFGTGATGGYGITGGSTGPRFMGEGSTLVSRTSALLINTTTLTQVIGFTAPANFFRAGTVIECSMAGVQSNAAAASNHTVAIRIGGVVVAQTVVALGATARTNAIGSVNAKTLVLNAGATGTALGPVTYYVTGGAAIVPTATTSAGTINTTIANVIELVITSSVATSTYNVLSAELRLANQ
jgi:hypothetical protein